MGRRRPLISDDVQEARGLSVGDAVHITYPSGSEADVTVVGVIDGSQLDADWMLDDDTFREGVPGSPIQNVYIRLAPGVDAEAARPTLEATLAPYPTVQLQNIEEVKQTVRDQIGQLLGLLSGMLALSVIIALFGIVNTLGLSVFERTRELGLLRASAARAARSAR